MNPPYVPCGKKGDFFLQNEKQVVGGSKHGLTEAVIGWSKGGLDLMRCFQINVCFDEVVIKKSKTKKTALKLSGRSGLVELYEERKS